MKTIFSGMTILCFMLCPALTDAKVNPAQSIEELERTVVEPGNEELSVLSNVQGLETYYLGMEPFLPTQIESSLSSNEDSIYNTKGRTGSPSTGDASSSRESSQ